jgi:hypothetical protein
MSDEQEQEHNQEHPQEQAARSTWSAPDPADLDTAITTALNKRKKQITRTIICKLHKPSRRKARALLWAQVQVTNMTAHILEALRETPGEVRDDKALAFIQEMYARKAQGYPKSLTMILADLLATAFTEPGRRRSRSARDTDEPADASHPAAEEGSNQTTWTSPAVPFIRAADYPVTSHLRTGAYRETARMLINWYIRIRTIEDSETTEPSDERPSGDAPLGHGQQEGGTLEVPGIAAVHARWSAKRGPYEAARETIVPFGRHQGKTLAEVGKREVRWLRERLIPEHVARETLEHIAVLQDTAAYRHDPDRIRRARHARHPWRRRTTMQRTIKVNRAFQRSLDIREPLIRLQTLTEDELLTLQSELEEMVEFASQFETIRQAVDIFLHPAPASYPTVHALRSGAALQETRAAYETALEDLRVDIFEDDQEGADTALQSFQSVASDLGRPALQPLVFKRPMQPGVATFALLFSTATPDAEELHRKYGRMSEARRQRKVAQVLAEGDLYEYVLAVVVHGEDAFRQPVANEPHHETEAATSEQDVGIHDIARSVVLPPERFEPTVHPDPPLFYVNYPHTPFSPPRGTSLLLFPLEFGEDYQEQTFLRQIIARQTTRQAEKLTDLQDQQRERERQAAQTEQQSTDGARHQKTRKAPQSIEECFPRNAPLGSARILSRRNEEGHREFFIHLPIEESMMHEKRCPTRIIGFHEHAAGYSYAILDFQGQVQRVGDVPVPAHALPKEDDRWYSDNYAFETVKAMIELTHLDADGVPDALIGLERATWRKQRVTLSREQNRLQFARPSAKIAGILIDKAIQVGLTRPHEVNVSLYRCSKCDTKHDASLKNTYLRTTQCATCGSIDLQETEPESGELACSHCGSIWQEYEPWFICPTSGCGYQQMVRLNTAIVTARYALTHFVAYWKRAQQTSEERSTDTD